MFPAIFLDRDGVLIENRDDHVREWSHVQPSPEAFQALALPGLENYCVVIVTNQSAVGRGLMTLETAQEINTRLLMDIRALGGRLDGIFMCPHAPDEGCTCRKPRPGLLLQAAHDLHLDLASSWMVGDAWSDLLAGQAAGVHQAILLRTGRGRQQLELTPPGELREYLVSDHLSAAFKEILRRPRS